MKTEDILNLDYRKEENQEIIQKVLKKIKPLSRYTDVEVPLEMIEKFIGAMCKKYEVTPQWMRMTYEEPMMSIYSIGVKTTDDHKWLGDVYGMCLYEAFAKLAIKIYSEIKKGNVRVKTKTKEEKLREKAVKEIEKKGAGQD